MVCVDVSVLLSVKALVTAIEHVDRICREETARPVVAGVDYIDEEETAHEQAL